MKGLDRSSDRVIENIEANAFLTSPPLHAVRSTDLCGIDTLVCAEVSFLRAQAPAGVPVPHEVERRSLEHTSWALHGVCQVKGSLKAAWQIILAALREVLDENAYERFLARTQNARSAESYRAFLRERETLIARKPKCC